jgi:hypothetical protein
MGIGRFLGSGLTVTFSDPVTARSATGSAWFLVDVEYPVGLTEFPRPSPATGPTAAVAVHPLTIPPGTTLVQRVLETEITLHDRRAVFRPNPLFGPTFRLTLQLAQARQALCRVTLKCNALADERGQAVDGSWVEQRLPSGDGTPGGEFESWFFLNSSDR